MKTQKTLGIFFIILIVLAFSAFLSQNAFAADINWSPSCQAMQVAQADDEDELSSMIDDLLEDDEAEDEDIDEGDFDKGDVMIEDDIEDDVDDDDLIDKIIINTDEASDKIYPEGNDDSFIVDTFAKSPSNTPCKPSECSGKVIFRIDSTGVLPGTTCLKPGAIIEVMNDTNYPARAYFKPLGLTNYGELYLMANQKGQVIAGSTPMNGKMTVIIEAPGNPGKIYSRYDHDIIICPMP